MLKDNEKYIILVVPEEGRIYPYYTDRDNSDPFQDGLSINEEDSLWSFKKESITIREKIGNVANVGPIRFACVVGVFVQDKKFNTKMLNEYVKNVRKFQ